MPSRLPLPTVAELVKAFHDGVTGQRIATEDRRDGSCYDLIAGTSAILWSQQAQRDRDAARSIYFDDADGVDLSDRGESLYGITRNLDAYGVGTLTLKRATNSAGAGTIWTGTRLRVTGANAMGLPSGTYAVTSDVSVGATATVVPAIPIRATVYGPGVAIDSSKAPVECRVTDALWDASWQVQAIACSDGTLFEKARDYRARVRQTLLEDRVGYQTEIILACQAAGAATVVVFPPNYAGDANDYGVSAVYVGDANYTGTTMLVQACTVALESVRVLGVDPIIGPMVNTGLTMQATVTLAQNPALVETTQLGTAIVNAVCREFTGASKGFSFTSDSIAGAVASASDLVQSVSLTLKVGSFVIVEETVMTPAVGVQPPTFPNALARYVLLPQNVALTFAAPQ